MQRLHFADNVLSELYKKEEKEIVVVLEKLANKLKGDE